MYHLYEHLYIEKWLMHIHIILKPLEVVAIACTLLVNMTAATINGQKHLVECMIYGYPPDAELTVFVSVLLSMRGDIQSSVQYLTVCYEAADVINGEEPGKCSFWGTLTLPSDSHQHACPQPPAHALNMTWDCKGAQSKARLQQAQNISARSERAQCSAFSPQR